MEAPRSEGLPSPRSVSTATISSQSRENEKYTLMLMQWGQFVDHDITHTPVVKVGADWWTLSTNTQL